MKQAKKTVWMAAAIGFSALAAETPGERAEPQRKPSFRERRTEMTDPVKVVGSKLDVERLPGSAAYIDKEDMERHRYDDIHRILRRVPGVYLREEEGFGLFPNLSLRGVDAGRSQKVTFMEDGVLIAPAPYSAPAAYYSPTAGRMDGFEVLKGSSQIKYGPHITGGVLNYLTPPIPETRATRFSTAYGSFKEIRTHFLHGDTLDAGYGHFGYLIQGYRRETNGFKKLTGAPDFPGDTANTGFTGEDILAKFSWTLDREHRFVYKIGYAERDANETYLGLTETDFSNDPYQRYSGTRFDNFSSRQRHTYLRHFWDIDPETRLTTTAYYNTFDRNWFKIQGDGSSLYTTMGINNIGVYTGTQAGTLSYRNNKRAYGGKGIDVVFRKTFETGDFAHDAEAGYRRHVDYMRRFESDTNYTVNAAGVITDVAYGVPGAAANLDERTTADAFFVKDSVTWGDLTLVPGYRFERLDLEFDNRLKPAQRDLSDTMSMHGGGLGALYAIRENLQAFGGYHRGFSPPSPSGRTLDRLREETSNAWEAGLRYREGDWVAESVYFLTDLDRLLVRSNIGAGGTGFDENVGSVRSQGIELGLAWRGTDALARDLSLPVHANYTYTDAEIRSSARSTDTGSIFAGAVRGNRVPYVPRDQFTIGVGVESGGDWAVHADVNYVDRTYTTGSNSHDTFNPMTGKHDGRFGRTDRRTVVDLSGRLALTENLRATLNVYNLFDKEYVVSRHPIGPRPGQPLTVLVGLDAEF